MGKIHVLDKTVSNMIAAGEVVERPASVVKELLENSMDAGASHITVEIKAGGVAYIRVMDDGCGMTAEDTKVCLLRHATSKISTAEDLAAIHTLGFRGEALASIAAVSKLDIYTKAMEEECGTHLSCVCGEMAEPEEAGCPQGTTVVVRDLFCSTPARMKFLKKDYTEAGYIEDMLNRLALSHPEISFKLIHNGKEVLFTAGDGDLLNCVYSVYGKEVGKAMTPVHFEELPVRVSGLAGRGEIARPNRNMQNFFINGRYIKSPLLSRAAEDAYKNELMTGKFPVCVLSVCIDPSLVDINVHPTKLEAKFADEKQVYHCMYWAVKNALHQGVHIPKVEKDIAKKPFAVPESFLTEKTAQSIRVEEIMAKKQTEPERAFSAQPGNQKEKERAAGTEWQQISAQPLPAEKTELKSKSSYTVREDGFSWTMEPAWPKAPHISYPEPEKEILSAETVHSQKTAGEVIFDSDKPRAEESEEKAPEPLPKPDVEYKICGQVFDTYIIVEKGGEMLMVDQHAAHERLRYEELLRQYRSREIAAQSLLIPAVVSLSAQEMAVYREHKEDMEKLGFDSEEFGTNAVAIRATPEDLAEDELCALFLEIITKLSENRKNAEEDAVSRMLYSIACKGAVKANHPLHEQEMKTLLDAVFALDGINTCPHGRPITIAFSKNYIEKQFKRIVS